MRPNRKRRQAVSPPPARAAGGTCSSAGPCLPGPAWDAGDSWLEELAFNADPGVRSPKRLLEMNPHGHQATASLLQHAPSEVELGRKDELLYRDFLVYLLISLKPCLYCLFAQHDFSCYLEQNDLEKQLRR